MYTCGKSFFGLLAPTSSDLAARGRFAPCPPDKLCTSDIAARNPSGSRGIPSVVARLLSRSRPPNSAEKHGEVGSVRLKVPCS